MNKNQDKPGLLYTTLSSQKVATTIAEKLVGQKVASCCNLIDGVKSIYHWQEKLQSDDEVIMLVKTTQSRLAKAFDLLIQLHPYDIPCIVEIELGSIYCQDYLKWLMQNN